jgi:hypothetical protein
MDENAMKLDSSKSILAEYESRLKSYFSGNSVPLKDLSTLKKPEYTLDRQ